MVYSSLFVVLPYVTTLHIFIMFDYWVLWMPSTFAMRRCCFLHCKGKKTLHGLLIWCHIYYRYNSLQLLIKPQELKHNYGKGHYISDTCSKSNYNRLGSADQSEQTGLFANVGFKKTRTKNADGEKRCRKNVQ